MTYPDSQDGIDDEPLASDLWDFIKNAHPRKERRILVDVVPPLHRKRHTNLG